MPPPLPEQVQLIRRFEPILFFDPQERFFPSDAKQYLENCALWKPNAPFLERTGWGPPDPNGPAIPAGKIATKSNEKRDASEVDLSAFLNNPDCFLEMGGWKPPSAELPNSFRYANLQHIADRYSDPTDQLNPGRFWYHAEFFDSPRLRDLFSIVKATGGHDLSGLIGQNPSLVCYYLFFPGHDEGLSGCAGVSEATEYASFAGEWACIAVLLEDPQANGTHSPKWVGLTNRNVGTVLHLGPEPEVRVGMRIFPWGSIPTSPSHPDHPLLMVARGSHALYRQNEPLGVVEAFTPDDLGRNSCGQVETLPLVSSSSGSSTSGFSGTDADVIAIKILDGLGAGAGIGSVGGPLGALVGGIIGLGVGAIWAGIEAAVNPTPFGTTEEPPPAPGPITDSVDTNAGPVLHPASVPPQDLLPPNQLNRAIKWSIPTADTFKTVGSRAYSFIVDRTDQPLWPGDPHYPNCYTGRWGPNVEIDPQFRRFGMRFPNFWRMFFDALVRTDAPSPATGGNDGNTKLLLHFDGQNGATTFADSSASAHLVTANGDAQLDAAQSKFGGTSGLFDGTTAHLSLIDHPNWDLPETDFTIDGWFRWNSLPSSGAYQVLVAQDADDGANNWLYYLADNAGALELQFFQRVGGTIRGSFKATINLPVLTWQHLAVEKLGADVNLFQNGARLSTVVLTPWTTPAPVAAPLFIGNRNPTVANTPFNGWMDELRISKGVARYGGINFTPQTAPYF